MKWIICTVVLLFAVSLTAQQYESRHGSSPGDMSRSHSMDDQPGMSNGEVYHEIQSRLSTDSQLNGSNVSTTVTDDKVVLSGYVTSQEEHAIAVGIAQQYTDGRELVDQIQSGGLPPF